SYALLVSYYSVFISFFSLSLHDALPISILYIMISYLLGKNGVTDKVAYFTSNFIFNKIKLNLQISIQELICMESILILLIKIDRSEEHTSELQSRFDLVCRLLLEKK